MSGTPNPSPSAAAQPRRGRNAGADERAWPMTDTLHLGVLPSAVPCARLHARAILTEWGLAHLTDTAELLTSELVTNAIDASIVFPHRPPIALRLLANSSTLVIEVWDHSPLDLEPRQASPGDECGRGLTVITALSDRWGCERISPQHKVVWAELTHTPGQARP